MLLIGLTGSIATGKSTVSGLLAAPPYGLQVVDADQLARQVVEPGTRAYRKIVAYFGPTTPDLLLPPPPATATATATAAAEAAAVDGKQAGGVRPLNRAVLGRRVFGDDPAHRRDRAVLNGIVHPAVRAAMYRRLAYAYLSGCWAVVLDVPLLFESGLDVLCGTVLVVAVRDPAVRHRPVERRRPRGARAPGGRRGGAHSGGQPAGVARRAAGVPTAGAGGGGVDILAQRADEPAVGGRGEEEGGGTNEGQGQSVRTGAWQCRRR
ncbi:dephospho-kinase [Niveomyces insectorum RCEF 264]|uniref:Dephospho-kinase n=1 Tax=Niveomyces insectorum RCEF 264 TaxID=1081102 RepID=A0A168A4L3_9HYPO|nr:dephospho-kinase [Niveomyces insectorum RCEF 264]